MARTSSNVESVRQFAAANCLVRRKQVADALGLTLDQARAAIVALVGQGSLKRVAHGWYEFTGVRESKHEAPVEERIWRAMRINPKFAASDIAMQAGTTASYFYKRLREYRAEGYVKPAGQRVVPGGREKLWRLTMKGRDLLERPKIDEYRADPLVADAVKLNKLVCTGMARRFEDARAEALRLCASIRAKLDAEGSIEDGRG